MKKILALVLAVAMLSTTAFAARTIGAKTGEEDDGVVSAGLSQVNPGATIRIYPDAFGSSKSGVTALTTAQTGWRLCSEYFTISTKKFDKGANLIKEVKLNDDKGTVDIVLKDDYALTKPNAQNLVIKTLSVKSKSKEYAGETVNSTNNVGAIKKNTTYTYGEGVTGTYPKEIFVGYVAEEVALDAASVEYKNKKITKFKTVAPDDTQYETATIDFGGAYMEGRVYNKDKCYVGIDNDVNVEVLKLDDTASMRFVNITTNGLPTANTLKVSGEETEFIYKIADNNIVASGLKWSADDAAFVGKIRSSASYVISDVELKAAPAAEGDKPATTNPDTGANDVVGIAAALAVVSLVAAGAVSMKK